MNGMENGRIALSSGPGRWVVLTTVLGSGMAMLDSTVVNVALPRLGDALDADMSGLQWTINAYTLTLAGLILLGGSLGDRYGRRKIFLIGVAWFALLLLRLTRGTGPEHPWGLGSRVDKDVSAVYD